MSMSQEDNAAAEQAVTESAPKAELTIEERVAALEETVARIAPLIGES